MKVLSSEFLFVENSFGQFSVFRMNPLEQASPEFDLFAESLDKRRVDFLYTEESVLLLVSPNYERNNQVVIY